MFDKLVEEKIREAMENGEFDNLPGKGKPLDLSAYFATPEEVRLAHSILKNAGVIPEEIQLLSEINALKESLESSADPQQKATLSRQIEVQKLKYNLLRESARGAKPSKK